MERTAYSLLKRMESSWWYRGRTGAVVSAAAHAHLRSVNSALDYGAGYGGMRGVFEKLAKNADAFEPDEAACAVAVTRGYHSVFSNESSAFKTSHDFIGMFDVLEHIEDDEGFLLRAYDALEPSGWMIITVPAFMSLWSLHDVEHHHFRRYRKVALRNLLMESGFEVKYISYWNCVLFIPAALMRLAGRSGGGGLTPPQFINFSLNLLLTIEAAILRYIPLPFGLSLVVVARKK